MAKEKFERTLWLLAWRFSPNNDPFISKDGRTYIGETA